MATKGKEEINETGQEKKFLTEVLTAYTYWSEQPGPRAKSYADAYRTLLNEFTKEETTE